MKKFVVIGILALLFLSCDNRTEEQRYKDYVAKIEAKRQDSIKQARWHGFNIKVIDSCEYVIRADKHGNAHQGFGYGFMSHKGNCKFCKQRDSLKWEQRKQELLKLLKE